MKRILITGGAGFIGSHLCETLLKQGNKIICLDNLFTGSEENIKELKTNPDFEFVLHDVTEPLDIEVDEIYNLACPASPVHYQFDPVKTAKTSVLGILNMLELARKYDAKILQASTSEVYGNPLVHPQTETYWGNVNPIGIRSCYDEGKRVAETFMFDYYRKYKTKIRVIRIFNTYGPKMSKDDGRVVSNFIVQALQNDDITVFGKGDQTRSFCYVKDLVDGIIRMMNNEHDFIGPVNLGNDSERTILEFAEMIIKLTNSKSKIVYHPLPSDDPVKRRPNLETAKRELSWAPSTDIETGIKETIKYFEEKIKGNTK